MRATNFKYDGRWLSDAGYIICTFGTGGTETVNIGSNIEFHTVSQHNGRYFPLTHSAYEECYTTTFNICKDAYCEKDAYIYEDDIREIMRWLNRRTFHDFMPVCYHEDDNLEIILKGSFNVSVVEFAGRVIGFELTFISNSPHAFGETIEESFSVSTNGGSFEIEDKSDEIGVTYPDSFVIRCNRPGGLSINNTTEGRTTYISGCVSGEIITLDCKNQIISTSVAEHNICNCFNYIFPRLINSKDNTMNIFTSSIPCDVTISYKPVRKVVL